MRIALVIFNLFALSLQKTIYDVPNVSKYIPDCIKEAEIDDTDFLQNIQGGKYDEAIFEQSEYRCFEKCLYIKFGYFEDDGDVDAQAFKEGFGYNDDKKLMDYVDKCSEDNEQKELCDKVFYTAACLLKNLINL